MIPENKSNYRPDIDGLRAIAVLLVVIYHAGFNFIPAGFVGVDVFFVISGFLITGIIHKEITESRFSFSRFYSRRVRRLMPALFAVILFTSTVALFLLTPQDLKGYFQSVISTVFSVSNIYFWRSNGGYFEGNTLEVPLLHTWSLSVEEQYYLLWPIFLVLTARFFSRQWFVPLLIGITIILVIFSQWVSEITFGAAYYLLPTRAFELLIGSIIALYWDKIQIRWLLVNHIFSILGIILIIFSAFYLNSASDFPGYNALLPTLGAALVILSGKDKASFGNFILGFKPLVWIGLISYSLYLWHWPIAVFIRYIGVEFTPDISIMIVIISVTLGWLSWKYIENPYRAKSYGGDNQVILRWFVLPVATITVFSIVVVFSNGLPQRFSDEIVNMETAIISKPAELRSGCHSPSRHSNTLPNVNCKFGNLNSDQIDSLMIGDSHSNHYAGFMDVITKDAGISIMDYTLDECLPIFDFKWGNNFYYSNKCEERNKLAKNFIKSNSFKYVVLAGHWPTENRYHYAFKENGENYKKEEFKNVLKLGFLRTIDLIEDSGAKVIIIKDTAPSGHISPKCTIKNKIFGIGLDCDVDKAYVTNRDKMIDSIFDEIRSINTNVMVFDPKMAMCDEDKCYASIDETPLFLDKNHLNDMGSRKLGEKYLEISGNPFTASVDKK